ncbi:glutathione S-transferase theta-1-like [Styela clava]|uniref:glutathione S-transferase theta-1-like n=1 Tax=Styela clava TaxID=7725 RepID=UPI0019396A14|nr:glutathione S-transferase theta-1-like [Styela clava]
MMTMSPTKYYYDLMSQPCRAIYIFLKCARIPFQSEVVALRKGEHRTPDYLKLNPMGLVPVIDDNGFVLTESVAIMKYLADKYSADESLYPKDLQLRAKVDEYCAWQHLNTRMKSAKVFIAEVIMSTPSSDVGHLVDNMNKMLDQFENIFLKKKKFIAGDQLTIADLLAACEIMQPTCSGRDVLAGRPVIKAWMDRVRNATNPYFDEAHAMVYRVREKRIKQKL